MNISKRKNRPTGLSRYPSDNRQAKGKSVQAQGVYNNTYFMHAATALVGNLVQVHLRSGNVYEGIFRTFSPNFDVALELPFCIKHHMKTFDNEKPVPNCMIFTYDNIVNIIAKEFDPNYAMGGGFQTDNVISEKFVSRLDEKELEPWDPSGLNGEIDFELEGGSNGWDANEMFIKNEKSFGVQSTFDDSLSDYTVQIEKRETDEYKEAEAKAEKLAQEIEKNPICRERLDLENGDEESLFAAVERPLDQKRDDCNIKDKNIAPTTATQPRKQNTINNMPTNIATQHSSLMTQRNAITLPEKFVQVPKRKPIAANTKIVRASSASIPQTNNSNAKVISTSTTPIQSTPSFSINQGCPLMAGSATFRHQGNIPQTKLNGDATGIAAKNSSQRMARPYPQYYSVEHGPQQMAVSKTALPPQPCTSSNIQENNNSSMHSNHLGQSSNSQGATPAPLPQRQIRNRDEQVQDLRKFQQDFQLSGVNPQNSQHQMPLNVNKNGTVSAVQLQQPPSPPQPQQSMQPTSHNTPSIHNHSQLMQTSHIHHLVVKQHDNSTMSQQPKAAQFSHPGQTQENKNIYQNHSQPVVKQTSPSPAINMSDSGSPSTNISTSNSNANNNMHSPYSGTLSKNNVDLLSIDKSTAKTTITKKIHVLNPSAKPFTPRSPNTPNPSRPHTPQTPVQSISGMYSSGSHIGNSQTSFYLMQPQQHAHPNAVQQPRLRRGPVATSQMHVSAAAAATGQPLLTAAPLQQFIHYPQATHPPHFPSQSYQPMMRMFHDPPPQSIQFLAQTPPSTTPSPGQPHQQFHPPPQPSPAGGGPQPTIGTAAQPYHVMCPVIHPQLVPNYYHQGLQQNPHQQYQILMPQHPAQ